MSEPITSDERVAGVDFSIDEITRYSRHLIMPELTMAGQRRLKAARVLFIGAGGLGSRAPLYLAAVGVGTIGVFDNVHVELPNLKCQILNGTKEFVCEKWH